MNIPKSYIVDDAGNIVSVILDYRMYKKMEEVVLDQGLAKAMEEIEEEDEITLDEAKVLTGFKNGRQV